MADNPAPSQCAPMDPRWHESLGEMRESIRSLRTQVDGIADDVRNLRDIEAKRAGGWKATTAMFSAAVIVGGLMLRIIDMWWPP